MIKKAPKALPTWLQLLQSVDNPPPAEVARILGISVRSVFNYSRADKAPRPVLLALFWMTPYGFSALDTDRENLVQVLQSLTAAQGHTEAMLRQRISYLEGIGGFGSANDPLPAPGMAPARRYTGHP